MRVRKNREEHTLPKLRKWPLAIVVIASVISLIASTSPLSEPARAAYPGVNGRIAFTDNGVI